jgi:hypothetical protein
MIILRYNEIELVSGGEIGCECCCGYSGLQQDIGCFETSLKCAAGCYAKSGTYYHDCKVECEWSNTTIKDGNDNKDRINIDCNK